LTGMEGMLCLILLFAKLRNCKALTRMLSKSGKLKLEIKISKKLT
jgi:hypothetical protein